MRFYKEPLVHFLLIGAALFGLYALVNPDSFSKKTVVVDRGRIENLAIRFELTWNRAPTPEELKNLVDNFVVEEVLYRQALEMGMDKNDPIIRRQLRQKMEFVVSDTTEMLDYSDEDLQVYLETHPEKFATDTRYTFHQVYIDPDSTESDLEARIKKLESEVLAGETPIGDQTMLPPEFENRTAFDVDRNLGIGFAKKLDTLPLGKWSPPISSGLGQHLIKITERRRAPAPTLTEVRQLVEREYLNDKSREVRERVIDSLLANYKIEIDWPQQQIDRKEG